jgi:hypothetical protein
MIVINAKVSAPDVERADYLGVESTVYKALPVFRVRNGGYTKSSGNESAVQSGSKPCNASRNDTSRRMADFFVEAFIK